MRKKIDEHAQRQLFTEARSYHAWDQQPVSDSDIHEIYELLKWGPTSVNANPVRLIFLRSAEAKARLYPALMDMNVAQVREAPLTAIIAFDEKFYEKLPKLWPAYDTRPYFTSDPKFSYDTAFRNSSLQGAYLILAARALGWDVCPLSGFDNAAVDAAFFQNTDFKSNFICNIGRGRVEGLYPRGPRLDFDEVATIA